MTAFEFFVNEAKRKHGDRFSDASLWPQFRQYLEIKSIRLTVERTYQNGEVYRRTGWVGVSTGWAPAFLLMRRSNSVGSSDVLGADDRIVAVKRLRPKP